MLSFTKFYKRKLAEAAEASDAEIEQYWEKIRQNPIMQQEKFNKDLADHVANTSDEDLGELGQVLATYAPEGPMVSRWIAQTRSGMIARPSAAEQERAEQERIFGKASEPMPASGVQHLPFTSKLPSLPTRPGRLG